MQYSHFYKKQKFIAMLFSVLGYVTMSVEYHSSKGTLKIRVWQITDLLLPPRKFHFM